MQNKFFSYSYFETPIWRQEFPEFIKDTNKVCDKYIKQAKNRDKEFLKKRNKELKKDLNDFAHVFHSNNIHSDPSLKDIIKLIGDASLSFLDWSGVNTNQINLYFTECWVQEFGKIAGQHEPHIHWNNHVSGFYFLKASDTSSYPLFHEPKQGALMTKLPQKDITKITTASSIIHHKVKPGTMIIFPSYLTHQFALDLTGQPFRFIHWNIQALLKEMKYV
jgi:uncharacterized protein (TIGR02466 family)